MIADHPKFPRPASRSFVVSALLDALPELYFYAKDRDSRFVMANAAEIELLGLSSLEQMLGKSDRDFFEPAIAALYLEEDRQVLAGERILNKKWMAPDAKGHIRWYLSSKIPLHGLDGSIVGHCGLLRDLRRSDLEQVRINAACRGLRQGTRSISEIATHLGFYDLSHFNRHFVKIIGQSPREYRQG